MEIPTVKMALITNLVLLIVCVQPVVANSTTKMTSTAATPTTMMSMTTLLETITLESAESPSTTDGTSSTVTETATHTMTSIIVTSSLSSSTPETTPPSTPMTTMPPSTTMTSTVSSSTVSPLKTTMTPNGTSPTMATAGPVLGQLEIIAIGVGVGVLLLVLTAIAAFCIYKKCKSGDSTDTRPLSKIDEDPYTARMSMHRAGSTTMNPDGDLAFRTFMGKYNEVDGIVNPTYDTTVIDEIPNASRGATIPSKARLTQNSDEGKDGDDADDKRDVEGAVDSSDTEKEDVASESLAIKEGEVRPISGVSYKSEDIDLALEVLDIGTV